jgi:hypothetical protein
VKPQNFHDIVQAVLCSVYGRAKGGFIGGSQDIRCFAIGHLGNTSMNTMTADCLTKQTTKKKKLHHVLAIKQAQGVPRKLEQTNLLGRILVDDDRNCFVRTIGTVSN